VAKNIMLEVNLVNLSIVLIISYLAGIGMFAFIPEEKMKTTAIVLSWNNLNCIKDTIRRLKRETPVIVVDNGSTDGSRLYLADQNDIDYIQMGENKGSSVARNMAISQVKTPYYFLIDGDIKYVPKSIKYLEDILDNFTECGCVGVNNPKRVAESGMNGTLNEMEADITANPPTRIYKGFPMAWTQYGLFRSGQKMPEEYPFDRAGHGYEDSWYYWEMRENGLESYFITDPLYYHDAHAGKRELSKSNTPTMEKERMESFHRRFGNVDWMDKAFTIEEVRITK
jgi:glycosyltransferase involved in cell wall biosynthesis